MRKHSSAPERARRASHHARDSSSSSATSPGAQPHEDWTKITNLAERRRIQNRIAQRNYRNKLKKRLEDLERKASPTSSSPGGSPEASPEEQAAQGPEDQPFKHRRHSSLGEQHSAPVPDIADSTCALDVWDTAPPQGSTASRRSPSPLFASLGDTFSVSQLPPLPPSGMPSTESSYSMPQFYQPYGQTYSQPFTYQWPEKAMPAEQGTFDTEADAGNDHWSLSSDPFGLSLPPDFAEYPLTPPELCDWADHSSAGSPADMHCFPPTPLMLPLSL